MTPAGWAALAGFFAVSVLPAPALARADRLVTGGRLAPGRPARRRRRTPWWCLPGIAAVAAVGAVAARGGAVLAVAAAAALATTGVLAGDVRSRRGQHRVDGQALTSVRVLVGELSAGSAPPAALEAAARAAPLVADGYLAAAQAARQGARAGPALIEARHGSVRAVGHAWSVAELQGSGLAGVLGRVAGDLAAAAAQRRATAVALSGPRSSAALLAGLPLLGLGLGSAMGARPLSFLLGAPTGRVVCCVGVLLDAAGVLWVRHLLRRAERPP